MCEVLGDGESCTSPLGTPPRSFLPARTTRVGNASLQHRNQCLLSKAVEHGSQLCCVGEQRRMKSPLSPFFAQTHCLSAPLSWALTFRWADSAERDAATIHTADQSHDDSESQLWSVVASRAASGAHAGQGVVKGGWRRVGSSSSGSVTAEQVVAEHVHALTLAHMHD